MACLKCGICIILSILGTVVARHAPSATPPPEAKSEDEQTVESQAPMLRAGLDNYDLYQYQDFAGLPIQDIFKTILLEHQLPKKFTLGDDTLDYDDTDFLLDNPILDNPLLQSTLLDNPILDTPYLGSPYLDSGSIYKSPLIKSPIIKRRPIIKRPILQSPLLPAPLLPAPLIPTPLLPAPILQAPILQSPMLPSPFKKKQTLRDLEQLLKSLLPLFKNSGLPMRARLQIGRQGGETTK